MVSMSNQTCTSLCDIIHMYLLFWPSVIWIFVEEKFGELPCIIKVADEKKLVHSCKTEHCNLTKKIICLWRCKFSSASLFLDFSSQKNFVKWKQVKINNTYYDITKTSGLMQVCVQLVQKILNSLQPSSSLGLISEQCLKFLVRTWKTYRNPSIAHLFKNCSSLSHLFRSLR